MIPVIIVDQETLEAIGDVTNSKLIEGVAALLQRGPQFGVSFRLYPNYIATVWRDSWPEAIRDMLGYVNLAIKHRLSNNYIISHILSQASDNDELTGTPEEFWERFSRKEPYVPTKPNAG